MRTLYSQSKVDSIACKKPSHAHIYSLGTAVNARIREKNRSPDQERLLENEYKYEAEKSEQAQKKADKDAKNQDGLDNEIDLDLTEAENVTPIVTLLFVFSKASETAKPAELTKKGRRPRKLWAMILWEDGPNISPVAHLSRTTTLEEYRYVLTRKSLSLAECGCKFCENLDITATAETLAEHRVWHDKFRRYYALRVAKFPDFKDYDFTLSKSSEPLLLHALVILWKQVDPDLPYFETSSYAEYDKENSMLQAQADKKAAKKALKKASKKAAEETAAKAKESQATAARNERTLRHARKFGTAVRIPREYI